MIKVNGYKVNFVVDYVTEPGEGWKGSQYVGTYETLEDLNENLPDIYKSCPDFWVVNIEWADADIVDNDLEGE